MKILIELFISFMRIGGFTFGGGYAMLPLIQKEIVERRGWASEEEVLDYFTIGQITPGVIAVNTATFIGYKKAGVLGGMVATFGVIFPSIVIISIIAAVLTNFAELPVVIHAFNGIRACVCVLILIAVYNMGKKSVVDVFTALIFIITAILTIMKVTSPVILVIVAGAIGVVFQLIKAKGQVK
ncbi:MAG: chromate transporter [[Eubacterium] sulci]|nr:chromate transporter [[Eubacterium] sulci]